MMKTITLSFITSLLLVPPLSAEVVTDGSLGAKLDLSGPDFQIDSKLGQQVGGNLFHSFQNFNLQSHESATFSGPSSVENVISRVTGGNPSSIDGTLRSTIRNADLYFLNPYGIMFGPNAKLDLQGGFHASTADYLRLQDGGRFDAHTPNNSLLTVAPIVAFGFLTDSPASIKTQSSKLSVLPDQTLSLIGGNLHLTSETPLTADNSQPIPPVIAESILAIEHGRVNLASLASCGEVIPSDNDLTLQGPGGTITIENTLVELSGNSGGAAFIRAGQFFLSNAIIRSNTFGHLGGKDINFKITESAYLKGINSEIAVFTAGMARAGNILMDVPYLEVTNALIDTGAILTGEAGLIEIHADQVFLNDGAWVASGALGDGRSGELIFNVDNYLSLSGFHSGPRLIHGQALANSPSMIFSLSLGTQPSGNIWVNTQELNLSYGAITASTHGTGRGGDITIHAKSARLGEGGFISTLTYQMAPAGDIKILVTDQLYLGGWTPVAQLSLGQDWGIFPSQIMSGTNGNNGTGGIVEIQANKVVLTDGGLISSASSTTGGDAGEIAITVNTLHLTGGGNVTTSAEHAGGGDIHLTVTDRVYLHQGQLTTSVVGGTGNSGNITIESPQFVLLNRGQVKAQADEGHGGNIRITAEHFIATPDSLISASSKLGINGNVILNSPNENISSGLMVIPTDTIPTDKLKPLCSEQRQTDSKTSRFTVTHYKNRDRSVGDLQPSPIGKIP